MTTVARVTPKTSRGVIMNQDVRKFSDEELIAILDKRVELESLNEAEIIDFIREVMSRRLF